MAQVALPRLVVAGTQSGAGKTTVALGLMRALARRGHQVQPYKVGPDYIDPTYHTVATGRPSRNLDGWMCGEALTRELFGRAGSGADVAVVEGVMGLFDGAGPAADEGSTAQVAKWLEAPVLLVVDARGMARSAAAMVQGYARFDPVLRVAGVVFNNVGSAGHFELLRESLAAYAPQVPALGYLPKNAQIRLPERHLGLVPALERGRLEPYLDSLAELLEATVDVDAVLTLARQAPPAVLPPSAGDPDSSSPFPERSLPFRCRIGVARDAAFHFYYEDGLSLLQALGAELVPFSPLAGDLLPPDVDAIYIGGGFPEVYRAELAAHRELLEQIRRAHAAGMPIYAECGGLMYLSQAIVDLEGRAWPMAGLLPVPVRMQSRLASLGYARATLLRDALLGPVGSELRGHEFHWSVADEPPPDWPPVYRRSGRRLDGKLEGFARGSLQASYLHIHFAANPQAARHLVEAASSFRERGSFSRKEVMA